MTSAEKTRNIVSKSALRNYEVIRTKWISDRGEAKAAVAALFGEAVAAKTEFLSRTDWGKIACVRAGALAWVEVEHAGLRKSVARAVCVNGEISVLDFDFPLEELLQSALSAFELTPEAICVAFEKYGTGGRGMYGREEKVVGFDRVNVVGPPTMIGDELSFYGRRGHRTLACVCHLPSRRAWMRVLKTQDIGDG